ncbi:MAG: extracellular solute-binding protein [Propionibacteriaceae bacterium]|nr:extracellular solute-binding protein [Propionibacteriaceae bacterium]
MQHLTFSHVRLVAVGASVALALSLAACSSGGSPTTTTSAPTTTQFAFLGLNENTTVKDVLTSLQSGACASTVANYPLNASAYAQAQYDQQLQLLAGQNALPNLLVGPNAPALAVELNTAGDLVDFKQALSDVGSPNALLPAAASVVQSLYDGNLIGLPNEFNIEGVWYNKKILSDNNITAPTTWDQFTQANATLLAAGVQPWSVAGKGGDGWNVTRLVGNYIFRSLGPDAMDKVAAGTAKLTDAAYVAGADAVSAWGKAGYFGTAPTSIDYATAMNTFLTGQAAFYYMGSWALGDFNNTDENQIGADNIGFLPFPDVTGGTGSHDQIPANAGMPLMMSKAAYGPGSQAWLKCIADNYGYTSLSEKGVISGFAVNQTISNLPALTQQVQQIMASAPSSVLWFEAKFSAEATTTSQNDAGPLAEGTMSGADFMAAVQADLG